MSQRFITKSRFNQALECTNNSSLPKKRSRQTASWKIFFGGFGPGLFPGGRTGAAALSWGSSNRKQILELWPTGSGDRGTPAAGECGYLEAACIYENLFIRIDILVKRGNEIQPIHVKAKSFDPADDNYLVGKLGGLVSGWKPFIWCGISMLRQSKMPSWVEDKILPHAGW